MSDLEMVQIGGETVSLAELAGIDFSQVAEKRSVRFPVGTFIWEVTADPEVPKLKKLGDKPAIGFNLKCINALAIKDPSYKAEELIGQSHRETFFISSLEDFGYVKAFLNDIGVNAAQGNPLPLLEKSVGMKFMASITHTPNKNDKDAPPYVNINREKGKIVPYVQKVA
jgi:hypothetical protein